MHKFLDELFILESLGYPPVKISWFKLASFWRSVSVWQTDGRTEMTDRPWCWIERMTSGDATLYVFNSRRRHLVLQAVASSPTSPCVCLIAEGVYNRIRPFRGVGEPPFPSTLRAFKLLYCIVLYCSQKMLRPCLDKQSRGQTQLMRHHRRGDFAEVMLSSAMYVIKIASNVPLTSW